MDWKGDFFILGVGCFCGCFIFFILFGFLISFCFLGIDVIFWFFLILDLFVVYLVEWFKFFVLLVFSFCFLGVEVLFGLLLFLSFDFLLFRFLLFIIDVEGFLLGFCLSYMVVFKIRVVRFFWIFSKNIWVNIENKVVRRLVLLYWIWCMSLYYIYVI